MPHKAQLLLQLAQAAAKVETRQQGVLPSVAVNVWDTITGTHAPAAHKQPQQHAASSAASGSGRSAGQQAQGSADHRLPGGLNFLHFQHHPSAHCSAVNSHAQQLLAQQAAAFHHWGMHPGLAGHYAAPDTAALYDNSAWAQHGLPGPLLHAPFHGLPRPAAVAGLAPPSSQRMPAAPTRTLAGTAGQQAPPQLGGARKARFNNNSISLNKQIMNTHSTRDLHTIVRSKGSNFDFFNISSAIARVPKLVGSSGGVQVGVEVCTMACHSAAAVTLRKQGLRTHNMKCAQQLQVLVVVAHIVGIA